LLLSQTFLGLVSLQTGTEVVSFALLLNKAISFYGILAVVTGYSLSALQLSMFLYSLLVALALAFLIRHVRKQSPLENLALAWLYVVDTVINAAYTTAFAVNWFLATFHDPEGTAGAGSGPGGGDQPRRRDDGDYAAQSGAPDTPMSIVLIVAFTLVRLYFCLVVMSHARMVLLSHSEAAAAADGDIQKASSPLPFALGTPLGDGFKGKLGRALTAVGKGYWLGPSTQNDEWAEAVQASFRRPRRDMPGPSASAAGSSV